MKKFSLILCLAIAPVAFVASCAAPTSRVAEVNTLKTIGLAVDGTMKLAAQMVHEGKISAATWNQIAMIHDRQFQPAYSAAVSAVQMNLDSFASPDLVSLAAQITAVLAPYLNKP